ncbi:MAG: SDR family oxidoreductase [Opitutaceae bacterium]|nr:SDR family oxidoreductase [Opitutaceae bacterium]
MSNTTSPQRFSLQGKVILLTGGAGQYGRGLARDLAETGCRLILASRDKSKLEVVAAEERARGYDVTAYALDQGDEASVLALRDQVVKSHGRVDGLVNNAVLRTMKYATDPIEKWRESMRVNADGILLVTRTFGEIMLKQKSGSIVNIGSIMGVIGPSMMLYEGTPSEGIMPPDYFFHKGGMVNLTRYFGSMYGPANVRVNCISPGGFYSNQHPLFLERYYKKTMLGRMANESDLGGSVIFLLSDASLYITGTNLMVDGGYTAI